MLFRSREGDFETVFSCVAESGNVDRLSEGGGEGEGGEDGGGKVEVREVSAGGEDAGEGEVGLGTCATEEVLGVDCEGEGGTHPGER